MKNVILYLENIGLCRWNYAGGLFYVNFGGRVSREG